MAKSKKRKPLKNPQAEAVAMALINMRLAEKICHAAIAAVHPIGSTIEWEKQGGIQTGTVEAHSEHGGGTYIHVRNARTDKSYGVWIGDVVGLEEAARAHHGL